MKFLMSSGVALSALLWSSVGLAADVAPDNVVVNDDIAVVDSLTGVPGDPKAGREWYATRKLGNCLACHQTTDLNNEAFHGEIGPAMDGVAERYEAPQLRAILTNSKAVFGDQTIMPGFYSLKVGSRTGEKFEGQTILSAQQVEDVIAYLQTLK